MSSGSLGSAAICDQVVGGSVTNFICGDFSSQRTFTVNGVSFDCANVTGGVLPARINGGWCMQASAGDYSYAYFDSY